MSKGRGGDEDIVFLLWYWIEWGVKEYDNEGYKKVWLTVTKRKLFFYDWWFSGENIYEVYIAEGVDYCMPVKMRHKRFYVDMFKTSMKDCAGGLILLWRVTH